MYNIRTCSAIGTFILISENTLHIFVVEINEYSLGLRIFHRHKLARIHRGTIVRANSIQISVIKNENEKCNPHLNAAVTYNCMQFASCSNDGSGGSTVSLFNSRGCKSQPAERDSFSRFRYSLFIYFLSTF